MSISGSIQGNPVPVTQKRGSLTPLEQGIPTVTFSVAGLETSLANLKLHQTVHTVLVVLALLLIMTTLIVSAVKGNAPDYSALTPILASLSSTASASSGKPFQGYPQTLSDVDFFSPLHPRLVKAWEKDLTTEGVEPNPGPPRKGKSGKTQKSPPTKTVVVRPKAPISMSKPTIGRSIGSKVGGWVGDMAQKAIQAITGFGDYTVKSNTLTNGGSPPAFAAGKHMTKVCHREFVGLVTSPGSAFSVTQYPISPKSYLFPWLSEIALSYEQYIIRGMVIEFKTTSATAVSSTNTALGSVIIATQYNVIAPAFTTQQQMEAYEFCTSCVPSQSMIHPIECAPDLTSVRELYMDSGTSGDPRLEYLGTTYVATVGQQANSTIGELWVSYEIDLIRPKLFSGIASQGLCSHYAPGGLASSVLLAQDQMFFPFSLANTGAPVNTNPVPSSDLPLTFPVDANGHQSQISFPGWCHGLFLIKATYLYAGSSAGDTIGYTGQEGTTSVLSGSASVVTSYNVTWDTTTGGGYQSTGAGTILHTATAPDLFTVAVETVVSLVGDKPAIRVVLAMTPYTAPVTTGGYRLTAADLLVTQISALKS